MLDSGFLRRVVAVLGIGATATAPFAPAFLAIIAATSFARNATVALDDIPFIIPPRTEGDIDPEDVHDSTGGIGENIFPDGDYPDLSDEDVDPEDAHDGTGGIGGNIP